jgi:hypothetical protein
MLFISSLVIAGAIVYSSNDQAGALLFAAGCALALVKWLDDHLFHQAAQPDKSDT